MKKLDAIKGLIDQYHAAQKDSNYSRSGGIYNISELLKDIESLCDDDSEELKIGSAEPSRLDVAMHLMSGYLGSRTSTNSFDLKDTKEKITSNILQLVDELIKQFNQTKK